MWIVLGTLGLVSVTIVVGVLVDRKWGLLPRSQPLLEARTPQRALTGHAPGEAPATALEASAMDIEKLRRRQRCRTCKGVVDALADDRVAFDGGELLVLQFHCSRCDAKTFVYITPT